MALSVSAASKEKLSSKDVDVVLASYRQAKAIQAKVKKTVVQEIIGTQMDSTGEFYFSKGKLRMEISEPERSTLVFDGKFIWFESRLDGDHVHVTKMRGSDLKRSDSLLTALFDRKDVLKQFKLKNVKSADGKKTFSFDPSDKKKSEVQALEIVIKDKDILRITYKDQRDNQVGLEFSNIKKDAVSPEKFTYKPPKKAEVSEF